ncbi:unnamed protein product, partial [Trichogramma brassicae]
SESSTIHFDLQVRLYGEIFVAVRARRETRAEEEDEYCRRVGRSFVLFCASDFPKCATVSEPRRDVHLYMIAYHKDRIIWNSYEEKKTNLESIKLQRGVARSTRALASWEVAGRIGLTRREVQLLFALLSQVYPGTSCDKSEESRPLIRHREPYNTCLRDICHWTKSFVARRPIHEQEEKSGTRLCTRLYADVQRELCAYRALAVAAAVSAHNARGTRETTKIRMAQNRTTSRSALTCVYQTFIKQALEQVTTHVKIVEEMACVCANTRALEFIYTYNTYGHVHTDARRRQDRCVRRAKLQYIRAVCAREDSSGVYVTYVAVGHTARSGCNRARSEEAGRGARARRQLRVLRETSPDFSQLYTFIYLICLVRAMWRAHLAVYDSLLYSRTSRTPVAGIECANKATQRHAHTNEKKNLATRMISSNCATIECDDEFFLPVQANRRNPDVFVLFIVLRVHDIRMLCRYVCIRTTLEINNISHLDATTGAIIPGSGSGRSRGRELEIEGNITHEMCSGVVKSRDGAWLCVQWRVSRACAVSASYCSRSAACRALVQPKLNRLEDHPTDFYCFFFFFSRTRGAAASTRFQLQDTLIRGKDIRRKSDCRATRGARWCARAAAVLLERKSMQAEDIVKVQKRVAYAGREAETVPRQDSGQAHQLHLRKFIDRLAAPQRVAATQSSSSSNVGGGGGSSRSRARLWGRQSISILLLRATSSSEQKCCSRSEVYLLAVYNI